MKKYEFKNYQTRKTAEVHTDVSGYPGFVYVLYYRNGEPDYELKRTTEPGTAERRFTDEPSAIRSAKRYVITK